MRNDRELPLVTLGMPTYNRADTTFPLALAAALAQTYPALEILVSDNASTDGTERLVASIQDPRIRYVRQSVNISANDNFNFCVEQARGKYFLLFHDDDLIDPDFVDCCMRAAAPFDDVGVIRTGIRVISQSGDVKRQLPNRSTAANLAEFVPSWFSHQTSPYCCNTLLDTQALRRVGGFRSRCLLFQDVLAHVRISADLRIVNVPDVKASVRRHEGNMGSAARVRDWCEDSRELLDAICEQLPDPQIRSAGNVFFARMNYQRALEMPSLPARLQAYIAVAGHFSFAVSPFSFAVRHDLRPWVRALKARVRVGSTGVAG